MNAFHFSLERVLHWRALELKLEETKLKRLIHEKMLLESELRDLQQSIAESAARVASLQDIQGFDLNGLAGHSVYVRKQLSRIKELCDDKNRRISEQSDVHRKAKQRHSLLEELRARRHNEWKAQVAIEMDHLAHESYLARWKPV